MVIPAFYGYKTWILVKRNKGIRNESRQIILTNSYKNRAGIEVSRTDSGILILKIINFS